MPQETEITDLFNKITENPDYEVYTAPFFYKRSTAYNVYVRDFEAACIYVLCGVFEQDEKQWKETDWANYSRFHEENSRYYARFETWEEAAKAALEFIETLKTQNENEAE